MRMVSRWVYILRIERSQSSDEEFMLLANRTVAEHIGKVPKGKKPKRLFIVCTMFPISRNGGFNSFILRFGHKIKTSGTKVDIAKSINSLLDKIKGRPEDLVGNTCYPNHVENRIFYQKCGHYGLAFDYYTHFTSPIRRYPI